MTRPGTDSLPPVASEHLALSEHGASEISVLAKLAELTSDDASFDSGGISNSISTKPHPLAIQIMQQHLHLNRGDNRLFPSVRRCETATAAMLGSLLGMPSAFGMCTSGATEANLLAVHSALKVWRARCEGGVPEVIVGAGAHFSFDKIAELLGIALVQIPSDKVTLKAHAAAVPDLIGPQTALIVATIGSSETGAIDDIEELASLANRAQIPLHADAASGGLLVPPLRDLGYRYPKLSFELPGLTSIALDPHKFGSAPIPSGYLLGREARWVAGLRVASHYLGTHPHSTLLGTAPGAPVLASYGLLLHQGHEGLRRDAKRLVDLREHFVNRLKAGGVPLAYEPELMIVGIRVQSSRVVDELVKQGFFVSYAQRLEQLRVVIQLHQSEEELTLLADRIMEMGVGKCDS